MLIPVLVVVPLVGIIEFVDSVAPIVVQKKQYYFELNSTKGRRNII
jgi:hypothetical protein